MIFVECNPDKALVRALGISHREITHAYSKGNVSNFLARKVINAKGLVDEDPLSTQPLYFQNLVIRAEQEGIQVLHDTQRNNRVVVLCPRLEEWILKTAKQESVRVEDFGFSVDPSLFKEGVNLRVQNFEKLLEHLKATRRLKALQEILFEKQ